MHKEERNVIALHCFSECTVKEIKERMHAGETHVAFFLKICVFFALQIKTHLLEMQKVLFSVKLSKRFLHLHLK